MASPKHVARSRASSPAGSSMRSATAIIRPCVRRDAHADTWPVSWNPNTAVRTTAPTIGTTGRHRVDPMGHLQPTMGSTSPRYIGDSGPGLKPLIIPGAVVVAGDEDTDGLGDGG